MIRSLTNIALLVLALALLAARVAVGQAPAATSLGAEFDGAVKMEKQGKLQDAVTEYERIIAREQKGNNLTVLTAARFGRADLLVKLNGKQDALNEYDAIVRDNRGKQDDAVARALYSAGLYAGTTFGTTDSEKQQALDVAHKLWKQLRDDEPTTEWGKKLLDPGPAGTTSQWDDLLDRIDKRNSADWKYQVIDQLVKLTGRNKTFSYGAALILMAILVRILLLPLTIKQYGSMREMQRMQPLVKELNKKYKGKDLQEKTMELYKQHGVNPFAGCWPSLVQMPFLIMIFNAIREYEIAFGRGSFLWVGSAASQNSPIIYGHRLLGRNLAEPDILLLLLYVVTNYITMRMTPATDPQQQQQQQSMALMTSGMFFFMFLSYKWSSAFIVYWLALNLIAIAQQYKYVILPAKQALADPASATAALASGPASSGGDAASRPSAGAGSTGTRVRPRRKKR